MRVALCFLVSLVGCKPTAPSLAPGLTWVSTSADPMQWSGPDWLQLVTPVRPPTSTDRSVHIVTALRLPPGAVLGTTMPPGARAIRVEFAGSTDADDAPATTWRVLDVRSFEWRADSARPGLTCGVWRPSERGLSGLEWACGVVADQTAGQALAELVRGGWLRAPAERERREAAAVALARINECAVCHQAGREEDRTVSALVQRGTDGSGLFTLRSMFRDEDPVERYRPVDPNVGDPLLTPVCPGATIEHEAARCSDGLRPRVRLDVVRGLATEDRHVAQLCAARRRLASRLDERAREAVAPALAACDR